MDSDDESECHCVDNEAVLILLYVVFIEFIGESFLACFILENSRNTIRERGCLRLGRFVFGWRSANERGELTEALTSGMMHKVLC